MKKIIFSAAAFAVVAVSTAVVAPTTSEAIPAFARQTGAACLSCHFQSFPSLAPMGRAFKEGAFTDVGEQALVEDEDLSITSSVNLTMVLRPQFVSTSSAGVTTKTANIVADQVILFGGRLGTNSGVFVEYDGTYANYQQYNSWDFDGLKAGVTVFNTGFGENAGMQINSVSGQHGGLMSGKALTASNQINANTGGNMGGVAIFAANDMINASVSFITLGAALDGAVGNGWKLAPSLNLFVHQEVGDFELGFGGTLTNGRTGNSTTVAAIGQPVGTTIKMKKWVLRAQAQGEMGDMLVGIYADYAKAAAATASEYNPFAGTATGGQVTGYSVRANIKPLHNVILQIGAGTTRTDVGAIAAVLAAPAAAATVVKTTQLQVGAEYELYQNFVISLVYNSAKTTDATAGTAVTTKTTTLDIEALL